MEGRSVFGDAVAEGAREVGFGGEDAEESNREGDDSGVEVSAESGGDVEALYYFWDEGEEKYSG